MPLTARPRAFSHQALKWLEEASTNQRTSRSNSLTSNSLRLYGHSYLLPTLTLPKGNNKDAENSQQLFQPARANHRPTPVVLDLHQVSSNGSPHSHSIKKHELRNQVLQLQKAGYMVVGISNASEDVKRTAADLELPYFIGTRLRQEQRNFGVDVGEQEEISTASDAAAVFVEEEKSVRVHTVADPLPPMVVTHPVRSGQQIFAQNRSLIVLGNVSSGAEVMADEDVVVMGVLKGRALAGIGGNVRARIVCHSFDAELISIAHCFTTCDDVEQNETGSLQLHKPTTISLQDDQLFFESSSL
ncbi:unnamed protein product [Peronospora belbahrii]|uniref:Septum formation inhibitor MinC C-terminal domain-containing protein n=1 Tax=Peronospora belbahrii TaxID=622444 RepID=A0AAU9L725_9STRA|nr:unnamed protein product [Peronospora belbahrii]CAH0521673.1 unnamed protein product [Peronospora belbahrii]